MRGLIVQNINKTECNLLEMQEKKTISGLSEINRLSRCYKMISFASDLSVINVLVPYGNT